MHRRSVKIIRTTLALPADLLEAMDLEVQRGAFHSRNEFTAFAVRRELAALERGRIDAEFAAMAEDPHYQQQARTLAEEFAFADWEALQLGEGEPDP
ncbi:ribbon-helix-helix domain-containing protein [Gloeobacter morelensis]|uniref:CopG family transcriptional regulator n=1 Tax=Gloeobacter morelensis MG652769 TaxID=2781736 RepID=A0ABY3PU97_9CYAN|nr:ribbon-helix-helix domain-containing protein [Gloeobacter morelensis]UFP97074.1 CopG family transcriptional regulator [Gloeobacter morelensis MG652769]